MKKCHKNLKTGFAKKACWEDAEKNVGNRCSGLWLLTCAGTTEVEYTSSEILLSASRYRWLPPVQPTLTSSPATRARTARSPGSASLRKALELLPGCLPSPTAHSGLIPPQINILSPISTHLHKTHLLFCSLILAQLLQKKTPDCRTDDPHPSWGVLVAHGPPSFPLQGLISARAA